MLKKFENVNLGLSKKAKSENEILSKSWREKLLFLSKKLITKNFLDTI